MSVSDIFEIKLKQSVCLPGLTEDSVRELLNALEISTVDGNFVGFVTSSNGTKVKFNFDPNGNFSGVTAALGGQEVQIIAGVGEGQLGLFQGPPSNISPGVGWEILTDLTRTTLNQPEDQNNWTLFLAKRVAVLNGKVS